MIDISVPLREGMVTYPGDPVVRMERAASIAGGDVVNLTRMEFGLHSGTHVDAPDEFARLDGEAAALLVERGVRLVGVDYLSVGDEDAHNALLEAGVVPVEGLDLRGVEPRSYKLICLPLRVVGADGAPARAILIRD